MSDTEVETNEVLQSLAALSAPAARAVAENMEFVSEDPECQMYRTWVHESKGKRVAFHDVMMKARRMDRDGVVDGWDLAVWLWEEHKWSNKQRSEATGNAELYWRQYHRATGSALQSVRDIAGIEHDDPDPIMGRMG